VLGVGAAGRDGGDFLPRVRFVLIVLSGAASCILAVVAVFGFWGHP